jgi:hypothetical protein
MFLRVSVADNIVFVGSSNGKLSALDSGSGSLEWEFTTEREVWTTPVVSAGIVYFGSLDHNLYAVDAQTGPVFVAYQGRSSLDMLVDKITTTPPEYDFVVGVRNPKSYKPKLHWLGNMVHNMIANVLFLSNLKDINSGMWVIKPAKFYGKLDAKGMEAKKATTLRRKVAKS